MSQRSQDNAVIKAINCKIDSMQSTVEQLEANKATIEMLRDTSEDDRVRFNAAKLIADIEMRIVEMRWKMYEHENPAVQRSEIEHKGLPVPPSEMIVRIVAPQAAPDAAD
jgi:glutathionylspermidine synthase